MRVLSTSPSTYRPTDRRSDGQIDRPSRLRRRYAVRWRVIICNKPACGILFAIILDPRRAAVVGARACRRRRREKTVVSSLLLHDATTMMIIITTCNNDTVSFFSDHVIILYTHILRIIMFVVFRN